MLLDIYRLVHSMSSAEKRYFQNHSSLHVIGEKNTYLELFEALNRQKTFDEASIIHTFRNRHLYLLKRHLQKSVMKALRNFHAASSMTIQLHSMITEIEVLYKKGLEKPAMKLLNHAKKIALHNEQHTTAIQLLEWEVRLLYSTHQLVRVQKKIAKALEESALQQELFRNFQDCLRFRLEVSEWHHKEIISPRPKTSAEQKKFSQKIKQLSEKRLSGKALWELYNGAGTFYSTIGNYAQSNRFHKKAAFLTERQQYLLIDEHRQYLLSLYTQGITFYYLKKYKDALNNLKMIREVFLSKDGTRKKENLLDLYFSALLLEGFILMDTGRTGEALPLISKLKTEVDHPHSSVKTSLRMDIYYQQTAYWFITGDLRQAQQWISRLLQDKEVSKENPLRFRYARLMQLILLFELGEFEQLGNLVPALKKFFRTRNPFKIEDVVLKFLASSSQGENNERKRERMSELRKKILRLARRKNEAQALKVFDYLLWIRSKMEGKTMGELMK